MTYTQKYGFSLIELLVVISIIAILVTVGLASYVQAGKSARDAKRKSDIETVRQALILYRSEVGCYPTYGNSNVNGTNFNTATADLISKGYLSNPAPTDSSYKYGADGSTTGCPTNHRQGFQLRYTPETGAATEITVRNP